MSEILLFQHAINIKKFNVVFDVPSSYQVAKSSVPYQPVSNVPSPLTSGCHADQCRPGRLIQTQVTGCQSQRFWVWVGPEDVTMYGAAEAAVRGRSRRCYFRETSEAAGGEKR